MTKDEEEKANKVNSANSEANEAIKKEVGVATAEEANRTLSKELAQRNMPQPEKELKNVVSKIDVPKDFKVERRPSDQDANRMIKIGSARDMAERAVMARNKAAEADEEKEAKRLKARRIVGAITGVLGGLGNFIGATKGAVPVEQDYSMLDETKKAQSDLIERKRKRAQENLDMLYKADADDWKRAKENKANLERYEMQMKVNDKKFANDAELARIKADLNYNLKMYEHTNKMEYLNDANIARKELAEFNQNRIDERAEANREAAAKRQDKGIKKDVAIKQAELDAGYGKGAATIELPKEEEKPAAKATESGKKKKRDKSKAFN